MKITAARTVATGLVALLVACSSAEDPSPRSSETAPGSTATAPGPATPTSPSTPTSPPPSEPPGACVPAAKPGELYELSAKSLVLDQTVSMCDYRGKVVLFVNVASYCGNTPQYEGLQKLYAEYGAAGLVVLGFPSNEFGEQEPGSAQDIKEFCENTYKVEFPLFQKVETNGAGAHPIYRWLKAQGPAFSADIEWNFVKFLVGRDGKAIARYADGAQPESPEIVADIRAALAKAP